MREAVPMLCDCVRLRLREGDGVPVGDGVPGLGVRERLALQDPDTVLEMDRERVPLPVCVPLWLHVRVGATVADGVREGDAEALGEGDALPVDRVGEAVYDRDGPRVAEPEGDTDTDAVREGVGEPEGERVEDEVGDHDGDADALRVGVWLREAVTTALLLPLGLPVRLQVDNDGVWLMEAETERLDDREEVGVREKLPLPVDDNVRLPLRDRLPMDRDADGDGVAEPVCVGVTTFDAVIESDWLRLAEMVSLYVPVLEPVGVRVCDREYVVVGVSVGDAVTDFVGEHEMDTLKLSVATQL